MKKNLLFTIIGLIAGTTLTATAAYVYTARDIGYQPSDENWSVNNVQEALTELKTDVNNISNKVEGIERVYKAGEVELVALVSDDSFYKDSNDKYVISNSDTGRILLADTSTYKSLASTEECVGEVGVDTAIPFKGGLLEKLGIKSGYMAKLYSGYSFSVEQIPNSFTPVSNENAFYIFNFDQKYSLMNMSNGYPEISIVKKDGTVVSIHSGNNDISDAVFGVMFNYNHSTAFTFTAK